MVPVIPLRVQGVYISSGPGFRPVFRRLNEMPISESHNLWRAGSMTGHLISVHSKGKVILEVPLSYKGCVELEDQNALEGAHHRLPRSSLHTLVVAIV